MYYDIAVLIVSRKEGNDNSNILALLDSLTDFSHQPDKIQVLIKYDDDDLDITPIDFHRYKMRIDTTVAERGRGYLDIHCGYNLLRTLLLPSVKTVVAMADDFIVETDWDRDVRAIADRDKKYYIIHNRPHPRRQAGGGFFNMDDDVIGVENLFIVDEAPMWSRQLMEVVGGFPIAFTDSWTICLEYVLWSKYKVNITQFLSSMKIIRTLCEVDTQDHPRWVNERKVNFNYMQSQRFRKIIEAQADNIYQKICEESR